MSTPAGWLGFVRRHGGEWRAATPLQYFTDYNDALGWYSFAWDNGWESAIVPVPHPDVALAAEEAAAEAAEEHDQITIWDESAIADAQYHDAKENVLL